MGSKRKIKNKLTETTHRGQTVYRVGALVATAILMAGCTVDHSSRIPLAINNLAMVEMERTNSILQKRRIASLSCRKAGYPRRTDMYGQCMSALISRDLQRSRERIDRLTQQAAQRHGMCMRKNTYEIGRCIEI